ncbi:adenine nucleotide alpha hydrolase [bacterium SCSIO 12741]|nr:adenine nucleotide alpha hydrolase [bacterium SCSIO 12741]
MSQNQKAYFNWSSGKDASLALYYLQQEGLLEVDQLLTSVNGHHNRVSMHGLRRELLERQAKSIGLPLSVIELPEEPTMEDYNRIMEQSVLSLKGQGYSHCGFGDIFLEDLRSYREEQLKPFGITSHFPLWKRDTRELIYDFLDKGFKAVVVCIKSELLEESFVGRDIDESFLNDLPANVDPCGENGEFHTFCYDGPIFQYPILFDLGEHVFREYKNPDTTSKESLGFWFCDLIPKD